MRAVTLSTAALVGMGRKTVSNLLVTAGLQFVDWSASYRLFSKERFDPDAVFSHIGHQVHLALPAHAPFIAAIDDTQLKKSGQKVAGANYRLDPLGPKFRPNFIWAQRFLQLAAVLAPGVAAGARTIPIDFVHAPTARKPKKNAPHEQWEAYKQERQESNLCLLATRRLNRLRDTLDSFPGGVERLLWVQGDGGYTNATVLKHLPPRCIYTGRIRQDAKLFYPPQAAKGATKGRKRVYGPKAPTPEELRKDAQIPWQDVLVFAAGKMRSMRVKTLAPLRSAIAGEKHLLRLIVIEPLGYRLRKNSKILYRKPAYLICTDTEQPLQAVVQAYVWRWEIEVNHRDEKNILGVGQAQVRGKNAVETVPAFLVASYAMALLAAHRVLNKEGSPEALPQPSWRRKGNPQRPSFQHIIQCMRTELWGHALGVDNFSGFVTPHDRGTKPEKCEPTVADAVLYACN